MVVYLAKATYKVNVHREIKTITREFITSGETETEARVKVRHLLNEDIWSDKFVLVMIEIPMPYEIF